MSVFPIGIGPSYDSSELKVLGEHGHQDNSLHLNSRDQLRMLLTLDHSFIDRMCRGTYIYIPQTLTHPKTHVCTTALLVELPFTEKKKIKKCVCFAAGPPGVCVDDNGIERKVRKPWLQMKRLSSDFAFSPFEPVV